MKNLIARVCISLSLASLLFGSVFITPPSIAYAKTTVPSTSSPAVKKSVNAICHAKGTRYYAQTKKFTTYKTLKDCLKSGGRLPKN